MFIQRSTTHRLTALLALLASGVSIPGALAQKLEWSNLPSVPDAKGFAGPIAGISDGKLLAAGGANFPYKPPWEGGVKRWYDTVFVLDGPAGKWSVAGKLPCPLGYSVCIDSPQGIVVLGGSNESGHLTNCFSFRLRNGKLQFQALPALPLAISNACGGMLDGRLYLAGGTVAPDAVQALDVFLSLDLSATQNGWQEESTWPGAPRMLATAATHGGAFYLVGGVSLTADEDGRPRRKYLRDAYKFVPTSGWTRIADLPWALAASPSPGPSWGSSCFLVLGGDDGSQVEASPQQHTGFRREVLMFDVLENRWSESGLLPTALVTTTAVIWQKRIVVPGGEARPGVRSTRVLSGSSR